MNRVSGALVVATVGLVCVVSAACPGPRPTPGPAVPTRVELPAPPKTEPVPGQAAILAAGILAEKQGRQEEARFHFEQGIAYEPVIADHHLYRLGLAEKSEGRLEEAAGHFTLLVQGYSQSLFFGEALANLAEIREGQGRTNEALATARRLLDSRPGHPARDRVLLILAKIEENSGQFEEAYRSLEELRAQFPRSPLASEARRGMEALERAHPALRPSQDAESLVARASQFAREGSHQEALGAFDAAAAHFAGMAAGRRAAFLAATECLALGLREEGEDRLANLVRTNPRTTEADEASVKLALRIWNREGIAEAVRLLAPVTVRRSPAAGEATYLLARIREEGKEYPAAVDLYTKLLRLFPASKRAEESLWHTAWIHLQTGHPAEAAPVLQRLASKGSSAAVSSKARYWQAEALERAGHAAAARAILMELMQRDPDGYYGLAARKKLEGKTPSFIDPARPAGAIPIAPPGGQGAMCEWLPPTAAGDGAAPYAFHWQRAAALAASTLDDLAAAELKAAIEVAETTDPAPILDAARCLAALGSLSASVKATQKILDTAGKGTVPEEEIKQLQYPLPQWDGLRFFADARNLDPFLVAALIRQESLFDPKAVSPVGARGLMQLMPSTMAKLARPEEESPDPDLLFDPRTNLDFGTRELAGALARFDGRVAPALAGYNAGASKVERWLTRYPGLPEDEFIESIPFQETRDYVKKVLRDWGIYRRTYTGEE